MTINWSNILQSSVRVPKSALRDNLQTITNLIYGLINGTTNVSSVSVESDTARVTLKRQGYSSTIETHYSSSPNTETHFTVDTTTPASTQTKVSRFRLFRFTNVNLGVFEIFKGNNSSSLSHSFRTDGEAYLGLVDGGTGKVAIGHSSPQATLDVGGSFGVLLPRGQTSNRPSNAPVGTLRFNTETENYEVLTSSGWVTVGASSGQSQYSIFEYPLTETITLNNPSNYQLSLSWCSERLISTSNSIREVNTIIVVTGTSPTSVIMPAASANLVAGLSYVIKNSSSSTLTIKAPSGSNINGGSEVTVPWTNGVAVVTAASASSSSVSWEASGDISTGLTLSRVTILSDLVMVGSIYGGVDKVGSNISAATTITSSDAGYVRHVTANVTVTIASSFRGTVRLMFDSAATLALEGGTSHSISANKLITVNYHSSGATVYRTVLDQTPLAYAVV